MPLFDFKCLDCGQTCELLLVSREETPVCPHCNGNHLEKLMAAHSSMSGATPAVPGPGDTACCGSAPGQASGCAGPGSCCGKAF
jgi:putative FmdB family regulatory protein